MRAAYDINLAIGWLQAMQKQGEDRIWRGADVARATMERLAAALEEIRIKSAGEVFWIADNALRFDSASVDRNPKGQDAQRLGAEHESAVGEAETPSLQGPQNTGDRR
jgi:hypothetical protein